ncbi:hypothetical protein FD11_GL001223 [Ligilactobacillus pobuzihii E100301 = KCTC 13174]|uniref:DUF4145 domain-containing protein n=2 Tax=Ligilactobacillus pobuzihii TaxID=449659 RepID=A0A0R2LJK9_9LACO|nr:hypothetical protein FD11_GL001223 [Ligilactobacillus pobuzihii E100301 = KCTC 13174]KRN99498.1 hypothetical protein IV66_GL001502 [Ligilactobacillus pobuzihii]
MFCLPQESLAIAAGLLYYWYEVNEMKLKENNLIPKEWGNLSRLDSANYICGYCGKEVGSDIGFYYSSEWQPSSAVYICPHCGRPSYKEGAKMLPGAAYGIPIEGLPDNVQEIYDEARNSYKAGAFTGVILISRKILANTAIYFGADDGKGFVYYVDYLVNNGYVPSKSRDWIDKIRTEGNSATHSQTSKNKEDAKLILDFVQMLLMINFKFNSDYQNEEQ